MLMSKSAAAIKSIPELIRQIHKLRDEMSSSILELPDNPDIERISENAFVMSNDKIDRHSVKLSPYVVRAGIRRLDPFFYDFKQQYSLIAEIALTSDLDTIEKHLKRIAESGNIIFRKQWYSFHPEVARKIGELILPERHNESDRAIGEPHSGPG